MDAGRRGCMGGDWDCTLFSGGGDMITSWDIYWITRLDGIGLLCGAIFFTALMSAVVWVFLMGPMEMWGDHKESQPRYLRYLYATVGTGLAVLIIGTFIPTTKEASAIYLIPKIANNEQVQKLPDNAMKFINGKFEEWVNDMAGKKAKK
jgi:hypothetical protein